MVKSQTPPQVHRCTLKTPKQVTALGRKQPKKLVIPFQQASKLLVPSMPILLTMSANHTLHLHYIAVQVQPKRS